MFRCLKDTFRFRPYALQILRQPLPSKAKTMSRLSSYMAVFIAAMSLLLFVLPPALAASGLSAAIEAALDQDPRRALAETQQLRAAGYRRQADAWLGGDPSASLLYRSDALTSDRGLEEYEAALSLPLRLPGQRDAQRALAESIAGQSAVDARRLRWQVAGEVLERLWNLRAAIEDEVLSDHQQAAAQALVDGVKRRVSAGELARADLLMARQAALRREVEHQQAESRQAAAQADWEAYTGLREAPEPPPQTRPLENLAEDHPLLEQRRRRLAEAQARRDALRRERTTAPELTLYARRDRGSSTEAYDNALAAEIRLPIGGSRAMAPQRAESEAALAQARVALAETRRQLELQAVASRQTLDRLQKAQSLAQAQNAVASERLQMSQRAFELGEIDLYLLLEARSEAVTAERQLRRLSLAYARAVSHHNHLLGEIPQ